MKRLFSLINLTATTILIYISVAIFYNIVESRTFTIATPQTAKPAAKVDTTRSMPDFSHYRIIFERDLFGAGKQAAPAKVEIDVDSLAQTDLKLSLLGTVTGKRQPDYAVIMDDHNRRQELYVTGDEIQGAVIKMILREKVILTVNGQDEILEMQKQRKDPSKSAGRNRRASATGGGNETITMGKDRIDSAIQDISSLMRQVRIRPYFENGKPGGLLVSGIRANSIFNEMGLKNGDVITGIDGTAIVSVDDALKLYHNLKNASGVELKLKRRGAEKIINYRVQ